MPILYKLNFLFLSLVFLSVIPPKDSALIAHHARGRCSGSTYCRACKNCHYCGHCNAGGSCGVCAAPSRTVAPRSVKRSSGSHPSIPVYVAPSEPFPLELEENIVGEWDAETRRYTVNTTQLNVRSGPSTVFPVKYVLREGDEVLVLPIFDGTWPKIRLETKSGKPIVGYALMSYLSEE